MMTEKKQAQMDREREHSARALRADQVDDHASGVDGHTLASAIEAAVAPLAGPPETFGENALEALGEDLHLLWYAVESSFAGGEDTGSTLNDSDVTAAIHRAAVRATAAGELARRIRIANEKCDKPATETVPRAELMDLLFEAGYQVRGLVDVVAKLDAHAREALEEEQNAETAPRIEARQEEHAKKLALDYADAVRGLRVADQKLEAAKKLLRVASDASEVTQ